MPAPLALASEPGRGGAVGGTSRTPAWATAVGASRSVGDPAEAVDGATPALGLIEASSRVKSRVTYVTEPGSSVPTADMRIEDVPNQGCEVCIYVLENKNNNNPFLCRNVRNPKFQQDVSVKSPGGGE